MNRSREYERHAWRGSHLAATAVRPQDVVTAEQAQAIHGPQPVAGGRIPDDDAPVTPFDR